MDSGANATDEDDPGPHGDVEGQERAAQWVCAKDYTNTHFFLKDYTSVVFSV